MNRLALALAFGILAVSAAPLAAQEISFTKLSGEENGTTAAFAKRKEEVLAKRGGKMGSHDWWWWGLNAFDCDNDGDLDLIAGVHGAPYSTHGLIFRNNLKETGKVSFTDITKECGADGLVPSADQEAWIWDFDGDGWLDVFGTFNDTPTSCLFNKQGKFEKASFNNQGFAYPGGVEDLNDDGYLDIWQPSSKGRVELLFDPAAAKFIVRNSTKPALAVLPEALQKELDEIAASEKKKNSKFTERWSHRTGMDLNNDGLPDVVVSAFAAYGFGVCLGRYLIADQNGKLTEAENSGLPDDGTPEYFGDLNGDGADDVLIIATPTAGLYLNDGKGKFSRKEGPLTEYLKKKGPYPHRSRVADLNNDGLPDLIVSGRRLANAVVFENRGQGVFSLVLKETGIWVDGVAIRDLNNDGLLDLAIGCDKDKEPRIEIHLNATAQPGQFVDVCPRMAKPNWAAVGARVEVFKAGDLGKNDRKPFWKEEAHLDGTPVHVGLGQAAAFDLRVTFPGKASKVVKLKGLEAKGRLTITPDGIQK